MKRSLINIPLKFLLLISTVSLLMFGCNSGPNGDISRIDSFPSLELDYSGLTIPPNIAPMNFSIKEKGTSFYVSIHSETGPAINIHSASGIIRIPEKKWHEMLEKNKGGEIRVEIYSKNTQGTWSGFRTVTSMIAKEPIDPYLYYRILFPGYESWTELSIDYRDLENFQSASFIKNSAVNENCVNCHAFNNTGKDNNFMFHMRGDLGGTYFWSQDGLKKVNLKTKEMKNGAVYPRWHPSGNYVAFSSNKIIQRFHSASNKKIEVSDLSSSLVLYDIGKNEIMNIPLAGQDSCMDTYPEWSPDGKFLYFCRARQIGDIYDYTKIRYNLFRVSFNPDERTFGKVELVFDAAADNKSISFPRISSDGRNIIVTMADYGCFPIWHKEADLYLIDTGTKEAKRLSLNSEFTDSYHSWSSNGRWLVFSSKRGDGLTARPYIAYIRKDGTSSKPFILPQRDPDFYNNYPKTFNVPEFSTFKINIKPGLIRKAAGKEALQAKWYGK